MYDPTSISLSPGTVDRRGLDVLIAHSEHQAFENSVFRNFFR